MHPVMACYMGGCMTPFARLKGDPDDHIKVEEAKLKIVWSAAKIETWLLGHAFKKCYY